MELAKEKRGHLLYHLFLFKGKVFKIIVVSQCVVYWINLQNIHTFTYQKTVLCTLLLLVFIIVENLQCFLKCHIFSFQKFSFDKKTTFSLILCNLTSYDCGSCERDQVPKKIMKKKLTEQISKVFSLKKTANQILLATIGSVH